MKKAIKGLRIAGWISLALAGYAYFALKTMYCADGAELLKTVIYSCGPVLFLLAGLILSIPRRPALHLAALGLAITAGVTYWLLPPRYIFLSGYYPSPEIFPFNLLPGGFLMEYLSEASYVYVSGPQTLITPLYRPFYLLGLLLLMVAVVLMLIQSRRERPALSASREGQACQI